MQNDTATKLIKLMDAYDNAHTLRKQLAHDHRQNQDHEPTRKALEAAMEAEEKARLELVNHENAIAMGGAV